MDRVCAARQVLRRERNQGTRGRQGARLDLENRDVDATAFILALAPVRLSFAIQERRQTDSVRKVHRVRVEFDLHAVRMVLMLVIDEHVAAADQVQPCIATKEEAGRPGQRPVALERRDAHRREQQWINDGWRWPGPSFSSRN